MRQRRPDADSDRSCRALAASAEFGWLDLQWHVPAGYATLALLLFRAAWGFVGSDSARFAPLPLTLAAAIEAFQKDDVVRGALGDGLSDLLVEYKTDEWARFCAAVTDWEQDRYEQAIP